MIQNHATGTQLVLLKYADICLYHITNSIHGMDFFPHCFVYYKLAFTVHQTTILQIKTIT